MRVLIVDDHGLFRDGLRLQLSRIAPDASFVEAASYADALNAAGASPFDFAFVDLMIPGQDWEAELPVLLEAIKPARIVILSAIDDADRIRRTFEFGIVGFIPKHSDRRVVVNAIRLIFDGGFYLPPELIEPGQGSAASGAASGTAGAPKISLTTRQLQVLALLCKGRSNKQIAYDLTLSEATIKLHINSVMRALAATNRTQAAMAARRLGIISD